MPLVRWQSAVDFLVLAAAIYVLLRWAKQARAVRIALAILGLNAGALLARNYDLTITSWVLSGAGLLTVAVLLVVFQPELRHTFMRLDAMMRSGWRERGTAEPARRAIAEAAFSLAGHGVGALIVLVRRSSIAELIQGGTPLGAEVSRVADAGVAGLHRLLAHAEALRRADAIIAVAGMEGALPSVVAGLVGAPVIAVPTSVGYGAAFAGLAPLLAMLNACAPGVGVVNIDNGFGAAVLAVRMLRGRGKA